MTQPKTAAALTDLPDATRQTARQAVLQVRALGWELYRFDTQTLRGALHLTLYFGPHDETVLDFAIPKPPA